MPCQRCNHTIEEGDRYCINCGAEIIPLVDRSRTAPALPERVAPALLLAEAEAGGGSVRRILPALLLHLALAVAAGVTVYHLLGSRGEASRARTQAVPPSPGRQPGAPLIPPGSGPQAGLRRDPAPGPAGAPGSGAAVAARPRLGAPSTATVGSPPAARPQGAPAPAPATGGTAARAPSGPAAAPEGPRPVPTGDPGAAAPAAASTATAPPLAAEQEPPSDHIDQQQAAYNAESVQLVVQHNLARIRACHSRVIKRGAPIGGVVEVQFTVSDQGTVTEAVLNKNTTGHAGLGNCVLHNIRSLRFPKPLGGALELIYPFVFNAPEINQK